MSTLIANQFTKEAIRTRMMQSAANLWGVKNPQALDPFVRLLIEAFSVEIYRAANESQNIETRILDKIAALLTPNMLTMPQPAHGMMRATPLDATLDLHALTHFYLEKRLPAREDGNADEMMDLHFTPAAPARLLKGSIAYVATGTQLFFFDEWGNKQSLLRTRTPMPWATVYIGLELDSSLHNLEGGLLYFDFPAYAAEHWVYNMLSLAAISCNGQPVSCKAGQHAPQNNPAIYQEDPVAALFSEHDVMQQMTREVQGRYNQQLITLGNFDLTQEKSADQKPPTVFPAAMLDAFGADVLVAKAGKAVTWLELRLPQNYSYDILENIYIALNAFPILNRSLVRQTYSYQGLNNILPLRAGTQECFMAVHRVKDSHDRVFSEIPFNRSGQQGKGYYALRKGGAERFDERSAQDIVSYLLELTRDEIAAFASLSHDFILTNLQELSRQLRQLQIKAEKADVNVRKVPTYLITEPYDEQDNLEVSWWISNAAWANDVRPGTPLKVRSSPDFVPSSPLLLLTTTGGRDELPAGERLDAYRYALGSRGRLVTKEDIRNFCHHELNGRLRDVRFEPGLAPSPHPKQGYIHTLDIKLIPHRYAEMEQREWERLAGQLHSRLQLLSVAGSHYRVMFVQEE